MVPQRPAPIIGFTMYYDHGASIWVFVPNVDFRIEIDLETKITEIRIEIESD